MRKNRRMRHLKYKRHRVSVGSSQGKSLFVVRFFILSGLIVCGALFYVYQHTQLVHTGYRIRQSEKVMRDLTKENRKLEMKISKLKAPKNLERLLVTHELPLVKPQEAQIVRLNRVQKKLNNQLSSFRKTPLATLN